MHFVLMFVGFLFVWACYKTFGPKGFIKLVLGIIMSLIFAILALMLFLDHDRTRHEAIQQHSAQQ